MGHYIRVLATDDRPIPAGEIRESLSSIPWAELIVEAENDSGWLQLELRHADGPEIAVIETNRVLPGQLGEEEIGEFAAEIRGAKPDRAAMWLENYLPDVRTIYAIQLLRGTDVHDGWGAVRAVQNCIWNKRRGILQADGEGFSNEDGYHILWQFADGIQGEWSMAVQDADGKWVPFRMDLGNAEQRAAFLEGRVPPGVTLL